jgi:hypothetical protein
MARKGADLLAAKERKKKIVAIVGAVLLVGILAIQLPRTLKMLKPPKGPSPEAARTADEETQQPGGTGTPAPASAELQPPAAVVLARDLASAGQLVSFSRFAPKDPFVPQVRESASKPGAGKKAKPAKAARKKPGKREAGTRAPKRRGAATAKRGGKAPVAVEAPTTITAPASSALIAVNGVREEVKVGSPFPAADKLFRLVAVDGRTATIAVVGGSLADGGKTLTLERGKPLTLMNTADGRRYALRLL